MDQLVQCPVCTLYLHNGMSLESHLDTHPKDQVIRALCSLAAKGSSYGSRTPTPLHSERSYRSRSRTPMEDGSRWGSSSHRSSDHDRYWRRTPSRTPKSTPLTHISRNGTPDLRMVDISFENNSVAGQHSSTSTYTMKSDKMQQTYQAPPIADFEQPYGYYQDQQEDREIKYSRSAEYAMENTNNVFTYNIPTITPAVRLQANMLPTVNKRPDFVKILPKTNNLLGKTNMSGMQYITPAVKPVHLMVTTPAFVQKNVQSNTIVTGTAPNTQVQIEAKTIAPPSLSSNQFSQLSSGSFTPGTTVVTQNSLIYREMVHNIDGKPFISSMPAVLTAGSDNMTGVGQGTSMYQNVMVVDQFGNTSCMYTTPQQLLPKACTTSMYADSLSVNSVDKSLANLNDPKTLVIEVGPIVPPAPVSSCSTVNNIVPLTERSKPDKPDITITEKVDVKNDGASTSKGLKILSNIKVEVPVQHNKNMINTIMDLTGSNDLDYPENSEVPDSSEKIVPDMKDKNSISSINDDTTQPSTSSGDSVASVTFSVIKNVGNPSLYKDPNKTSADMKMDTDADSCPVPDLICNEKPSISPCSELSDHGDNSTDHSFVPPKPEISQMQVEKKLQLPVKSYRANPLRLNNIYVKKHKKVLQIKNSKFTSYTHSKSEDSVPSSSTNCTAVVNSNKLNFVDKQVKNSQSTLQTISVEEIKQNDDNDDHNFDADTEEQSMDLEPIASSSLAQTNEFNTTIIEVKEEINSSNEGGFSNEGPFATDGGFSNQTMNSDHNLTPLETLRPINVITYNNMPSGDFDEESNHRELLDLEAASKSKQFVNMMNENYFGDNIYADYFTPDRVESFDSQREAAHKDGMYGIWGEPSQKDSEFVLPNFIHESYKIAESNGIDYPEISGKQEGDGDNKADVLSESRSDGEPTLNICADERMPPRGELSGQESNGDMESPWSGMYTEVTPSEPYDLIARESWVSDGSEVDATEKRDTLDELQFPKSRMYSCMQCGAKLPSLKELRAHKSLAHALPTCSTAKTTYSRMVTARTIKKEEKIEETATLLTGNLLTIDSKESITSTILQVYDTIEEAKPKLETLIKQEPKRRRNDYVCPTCKVDQMTNAAFHAHLKIHPLECLTCGKCFFKRANLALHMKTHLGIKNYKCEVCEKRFITRQKLMEHHNVHTGRAPIKCTLCDDTFRRYSNMVQHRARHHLQKRAKIKDYICHCGAIFHTKAKLRWHKETHEEKPKSCLYCSDKFVHAASLTRHVRRSHNEYYVAEPLRGKVDNVPCPVCKQIYLRTNLRAHLLTHSGKRPFLCIICNKSFTSKGNLKLHRWTHMSRSAKPFKCHLCKGAFIRQTEYISHMNAHKSVRPYTCNYCGCQFIRKYNCQRHVREHEIAKKYVCKVPECGKSFHRSYYLSEHMKVHSGARPFSCTICGKTSSNKSNHNKHVKIHHAREPFATEA
ncbi:hypothetical protein K1T71_006483 [Dendrolimus kikuchii]|uniref:Uncharacterized protein n=1 Tax=Dendrolimus kikuchii TaxID=765133 RepID=A0ACC1D1A2_9NEOP|nr:hypothetical protein K1T71_006483 [Dendrolimus kikuchii]